MDITTSMTLDNETMDIQYTFQQSIEDPNMFSLNVKSHDGNEWIPYEDIALGNILVLKKFQEMLNRFIHTVETINPNKTKGV